MAAPEISTLDVRNDADENLLFKSILRAAKRNLDGPLGNKTVATECGMPQSPFIPQLQMNGSSEEITLLEFNEEAEEDQQETSQAIAPGEEEQTLKDLPECPDHLPTSFLKGKSRNILSLLCFTEYYLSHLCLMH
ncbi:uncharacterized protein [Miscanthus floridulus]|uniref:uncharacterized protein n=1 Tax=Miscanthus floridulus TaxID=154761 RepID=UPI00345930F4